MPWSPPRPRRRSSTRRTRCGWRRSRTRSPSTCSPLGASASGRPRTSRRLGRRGRRPEAVPSRLWAAVAAVRMAESRFDHGAVVATGDRLDGAGDRATRRVRRLDEAIAPWRAGYAEALAAVGRLDDARLVTAWLDDQAATRAGPLVVADAARARIAVALVAGDVARGDHAASEVDPVDEDAGPFTLGPARAGRRAGLARRRRRANGPSHRSPRPAAGSPAWERGRGSRRPSASWRPAEPTPRSHAHRPAPTSRPRSRPSPMSSPGERPTGRPRPSCSSASRPWSTTSPGPMPSWASAPAVSWRAPSGVLRCLTRHQE